LVTPSYCYGIVSLTREALLDELAKEPNRSGSTERHASTKNFGLWKSFFKKLFALAIRTAQKNFCQVAELLMPREWCRKSDFSFA
jgi:hypothetical protein